MNPVLRLMLCVPAMLAAAALTVAACLTDEATNEGLFTALLAVAGLLLIVETAAVLASRRDRRER